MSIQWVLQYVIVSKNAYLYLYSKCKFQLADGLGNITGADQSALTEEICYPAVIVWVQEIIHLPSLTLITRLDILHYTSGDTDAWDGRVRTETQCTSHKWRFRCVSSSTSAYLLRHIYFTANRYCGYRH